MELSDAELGKAQHLVELAPCERHAFSCALHLYEPALAGHDDVHVDLGG